MNLLHELRNCLGNGRYSIENGLHNLFFIQQSSRQSFSEFSLTRFGKFLSLSIVFSPLEHTVENPAGSLCGADQLRPVQR